jgi:HlyD family secretion protein
MQSRASLEQARAQLLQSQASVREAKDKLARLNKVWELSGQKVPSREEFDLAKVALQKAEAAEAATKAQVSVAQAVLETNETDFSKLIIYSPVDGIVLSRDVEPGQTVQASFQAVTLFKLAEDLTRMELHVAVDEADVGLVKEGQKATFVVDAYPNRTFDAEVLQVRYGANTTQGVVTYETVLSADNSELLLRPGMTATAEIVVKEIKEALLIPNSALRFSPSPKDLDQFTEKPKPGEKKGPPVDASPKEDEVGIASINRQMVWTIRDGEMVQVPIVIGETDMDNTEVKEGELKPGDLLIINTGLQMGGSVSVGVG